MMWILWIGALLVVGGSTGLMAGCTTLARVLWVLAAAAFVTVLIWGGASLPGVLAVAAALAVTGGLGALTAPRTERRDAERRAD